MSRIIEFDDQRVKTNPADWYWREDVMRHERQNIFKKNWQLCARSAQLMNSGDYLVESIAGLPVILVRTEDGELKAYQNVCRHRAGVLSVESHNNCSRLRCIYHGWTYNLDGKLIKAPAIMQESGFDAEAFSLYPLLCESWNGLVFVNFNIKAESLGSWLGDIVGIMNEYPKLDNEFVFVREESKAINANWKSYADNSCEGYHLPLVHREMAAFMNTALTRIEAREGEYVHFDVTYRDDCQACWIYKYPNFLIACEKNYINIQSTDPLSPGTSRLRDYFWFSPECTEEQIQENLKASDLVTEEDRKICELVQKNLQTGVYSTGELSLTQEQGTRYFQQLVRRDIGEKVGQI
ncbi:MAG: Rieske 2Fe-2S domain-containing protein [Gammaproteobacteria bacterium]|nr:Rieske 2Fe-2S domain-containing protein [Gammaproteobacteria bacterium]